MEDGYSSIREIISRAKSERGVAWYSVAAARLFGTVAYATTDGRVVVRTAVMAPDEGDRYGWSDKVRVGDVLSLDEGGFLGRNSNGILGDNLCY